MKFVRVLCVCLAALLMAAGASAQVDYATKIQPIFDANCVGCHGSVRSGVTLSSYAAVMASVGTQYATKVVVPGSSSTSPLYDKVSNATPLKGQRMPRTGVALADADIALIKKWIDEGALANSPTSVAEKIPGTPAVFSLSQNYPNPFNPSTHIQFSVPVSQFVTVTVFDIMGRTVSTLVDGTMEPGVYSVEWNGAGQASGLYFYQLRAGDAARTGSVSFVSTKKFILQK